MIQQLLRHIFDAKHVPLTLLKSVTEFRESHRGNFASVKDTVKPGVVLRNFDFYFDFVLCVIARRALSRTLVISEKARHSRPVRASRLGPIWCRLMLTWSTTLRISRR